MADLDWEEVNLFLNIFFFGLTLDFLNILRLVIVFDFGQNKWALTGWISEMKYLVCGDWDTWRGKLFLVLAAKFGRKAKARVAQL